MTNFSVVIPVLDEELIIPELVRRVENAISKLDSKYEIIIIDDGSVDRTWNEIKKITEKNERIKALRLSRNFGQHYAISAGLENAKGEWVIVMDGDLQDPPEIIKDFYDKWQEGYNIVYGVRNKREVTFVLQFLYKAFYFIFNKVASFKVPVNAGDFSLIDRESVNEILEFKEFDIFLRAIRAYIGGKQIGIPYFRPERMFGKSTNNFLKNLGWATKGILNVSRVPLSLISFVSAILFGIGLIGTLSLLILTVYGRVNLNFEIIAVILILNIFLSLAAIISVAVTGEYVGRILEETKHRPRFLVASYVKSGAILKKIEGNQN